MRPAASIVAAGLLAGCSGLSGTYPNDTPIVPAAEIWITEGYKLTLEKMLYSAAVGAAVYYALDPLAPNWEVAELSLGRDAYQLNLRMKRIYTGGEGEARQVFRRHAEQLARVQGFGGYEILAYEEGIESSLIPRRVGAGIVRLVSAER